MVFVDLKQVYSRVSKKVNQGASEKKQIHYKYLNVINEIYNRVVTSARKIGGVLSIFLITVSLDKAYC